MVGMGGNRRYDLISQNLDRAAQEWARRPTVIGLTDEQVRASGRRTDSAEPVPVAAWVPHQIAYTEQLLIRGQVIAWTRDAVLLRYVGSDGRESHVWVWASAVQRLHP